MRSPLHMTLAALGGAAVLAAPALAQDRNPTYAKARAQGEVGEQPDGYLGIVGAADDTLRGVVDDINIKRRAVYIDGAQKNAATLEAYAFAAGCTAIRRTVPGEKYRAPDGSWQTRTNDAPVLDPRCPKG